MLGAARDALREVSFGVQEGQPMADWFDDWVEGRFTPDQAESFLRPRARRAASTLRPPTVAVRARKP